MTFIGPGKKLFDNYTIYHGRLFQLICPEHSSRDLHSLRFCYFNMLSVFIGVVLKEYVSLV